MRSLTSYKTSFVQCNLFAHNVNTTHKLIFVFLNLDLSKVIE